MAARFSGGRRPARLLGRAVATALVLACSGAVLTVASSSVSLAATEWDSPVPDVVGKTWPVAQKVVDGWQARKGIPAYAKPSPVPFPPVPDGVDMYVVAQDAPFVEKAEDVGGEFDQVALPVRLGVQVPDVVGESQDVARQQLARWSLDALNVRPQGAADDATVRGQLPPAGSLVGFTDTVTLLFDDLVEVPNVVSRTVSDARAVLKAAGLRMAGPSPGVVTSQQPQPGTQVVPGSTVTVSVRIRTQLEVPNLVSSSLADAREAVRKVGLRLQVPDGVSDDDIVTGQAPAAGSPASRGMVVTVSFATGMVRVPNVVGRTVAEATELLESLGLRIEAPAGEGNIVGQQPPGDEFVARGTTVSVTLEGVVDGQVPVPNLLGMDLDTARKAVQQAGLRLAVPDGDSRDDEMYVFAQDPPATTLATAGSVVSVQLRARDGLPVALLVAGAGLLLVTVSAGTAGVRRWRRHRWLDRHVRVRVAGSSVWPVDDDLSGRSPEPVSSDGLGGRDAPSDGDVFAGLRVDVRSRIEWL